MKRSIYSLLFAVAAIAMLTTVALAADKGSDKKAAMAKQEMAKKEMMAYNAQSRAYLHGYNLPSSGIALEGYCPVCYFAANKAVKGTPEIASTYNDVTYHFVSPEAKQSFDQNPEKFLPAYGGWCATGMALKNKFPVDPRNFKVVDGRLLLFLANKNINAQQVWDRGSEKQQLAQADAFWKTVQQ